MTAMASFHPTDEENSRLHSEHSVYSILSRDVTKVCIRIRRRWNFERFQKIQRVFQALCCRMRIRGKILVLRLISCTESQQAQTNLFLFSNLTYHTDCSY